MVNWLTRCVVISIHALREEGDTYRQHGRRSSGAISIHALREEGDPGCVHFAAAGRDFYPRPPRGGRREYYSTEFSNRKISIHALREEGDLKATDGTPSMLQFLSTPSARRATWAASVQ